MKQKVAIQGIVGSYHHNVAQAYFGDSVDIEECMSFGAVVNCLISGECTDAVMAIENSIAGSILPNYAYIDENDLTIQGEHYESIHHCLMALPGQQINDIQEVYSHPMALLQCKEFFRIYPHIKLVEDADTAEVAKRISDNKLKNVAAIAGKKAAALYGLDILAEEIQTITSNATRFFILAPPQYKIQHKNIDKASFKFSLEHKRGSLASILNAMSDCRLSLTKIQSMPIAHTPWRYAFFVDVTFTQPEYFQKAVSLMQIMATEFKILGAYKNTRS